MTILGGVGGHVLAANFLRAPAAIGRLRPRKLARTTSGICTAAAPVAKETSLFAKHGREVEFVNIRASTEMQPEALTTGKAEACLGMALRCLRPLDQGFDVKITAGVHGGCLRLQGDAGSGVTNGRR